MIPNVLSARCHCHFVLNVVITALMYMEMLTPTHMLQIIKGILICHLLSAFLGHLCALTIGVLPLPESLLTNQQRMIQGGRVNYNKCLLSDSSNKYCVIPTCIDSVPVIQLFGGVMSRHSHHMIAFLFLLVSELHPLSQVGKSRLHSVDLPEGNTYTLARVYMWLLLYD
jgi:hypothetical protein